MKCFKNFRLSHNERALGVLSVIGGVLIHISIGSIYTYGNMSPYILSYMRNYTKYNSNINPGNSMWIFGLGVFGLGSAMALGGFIETRLGVKVTVLMGGLIMSFGVILTYWTIKIHLSLIAISYGLIVGVGAGIAYSVALGAPSEWFPQNKGLVSGIIVAGFGIGPMIFDFIQLCIINKDVSSTTLQNAQMVPISFIIMGMLYALIQFVGFILISRPPVPIISVESPMSKASSWETISEIKNEPLVDIDPFQIIYERDFWILWLTFALNSVVLVIILSLHKVFGEGLNISDIRLVIASAIGALFNGLGRIGWGYLNDKIGYKVLMSVLSLSMSLMLGTFYLCTKVGNIDIPNQSNRYVLYFVWVVVLHILLSGNFSLFPAICVRTFGPKYFARNYGLLFTAYSAAGVVTSAITTPMFTALPGKGSNLFRFLAPFLVGSGISLISGILTIFYRGKSLIRRKTTQIF